MSIRASFSVSVLESGMSGSRMRRCRRSAIVHGTDLEFVLGPAQFRKKPAKSGAVERCESVDGIVAGTQVRRAECVDPRTQRQDLLGLVTATDEYTTVTRR